jgi:hypothetical protein
VKSICQFDQYDPDIIRHGQDHFSDAFSLSCLGAAAKREDTQFGYTRYNMADIFAEHLIDFFYGGVCIFNNIV